MSDRLDREFRYVLRRCSKLSDAEVRFLAILGTYKYGCLLNYDEICIITNWSKSKLNRVIKSLTSCGLIEVTYRCYKKTTIMIAPAAKQAEFANASDMPPVAQESYATSEAVICHPWNHDMPPVAQPILERELERKLESSLNFKEGDGDLTPRKPGDAMRLVRELSRSHKMD